MKSDQSPGSVALIGAGPGDPELITVRARRLLDNADIVFHDALVTDELLSTIPATTEIIDVGKRAKGNTDRITQTEINHQLERAALADKRVVRLKGGDPFVFGRGAEEAEYLAAAGIPIQIVPGITSVLSAGLTGIPLTHRDHASSLTVVTGHEAPEKDDSALDWAALAETVQQGGTLVVLMGVRRLPDYTATLQNYGLSPSTPVAMVQKASWTDEQTVTGTLESIVDLRDTEGIEPPALTLIGDVVSVREEIIDWVDRSAQNPHPVPLSSRSPAHVDGLEKQV